MGIVVIGATFLALLLAQPPSADASGRAHDHGRYGNPADLEGYIAAMEEPSRGEWEKADKVVRALGLDTPVDPRVEHRVSREALLADAERAGLEVATEHRFPPHPYFLALRPRR